MERITRAAAALGITPDWARLSRYSFIALLLAAALLPAQVSYAATLTNTSVALSDPRPNATGVSYTFTGTVPASAAIRCVKVVFATSASGSTVPTNMVTTGATLNTGGTSYLPTPAGWTLDASTNGTLLLTNASGETPTTGAKTILFNGITNGNTANTGYWMHVNTYNNVDCTSSAVDGAEVQFIFTNGSDLSLTVDQSLSFSVAGVADDTSCNGTTTTADSTSTLLSFGAVTSAANAVVCQDLSAATNATNGYTIYARYTGAPSNGLNTIDDLVPGTNDSPSTFSAAGVEAYGYSTNDSVLSTCGGSCDADRFTNGGQQWAAMTTSNAEVGYSAVGATNLVYRIGHQVGIASTTEGGTYSTIIIYTCTPVY